MRVTVCNHMVHGNQVHRPGCADIARQERRHVLNNTWDEEVAGVDVADEIAALLNESFGEPHGEPNSPWHAEHIRVMPCVAKTNQKGI